MTILQRRVVVEVFIMSWPVVVPVVFVLQEDIDHIIKSMLVL